MPKTRDRLPILGGSSSAAGSHSPRGRTPTSRLSAGAADARPQPSRRLSAHGPATRTTTTSPRPPASRRSQSHEAAPRFPLPGSSSSRLAGDREARGRSSRSGSRSNRDDAAGRGRDAPARQPFQSPQRYTRREDRLRPDNSRRDSYGSPSSLTGRLLGEDRGRSDRVREQERRYSFSPSSARPASSRQRTYSSEHVSPPLRSAGFGGVASPLRSGAASPTSPGWHSNDAHRSSTPSRRQPPNAEARGSPAKRPSLGESGGRRASESGRRPSIRSSGGSSREQSRGRRGNIFGTLATVAGIEGLVKHATTAQEWTDWLSDLQGSPEEMRSLSDKATTARDTVTQIQATLAARPDLLEGESGQRLKQHIEDAIESTNKTLAAMTDLLEDLSKTTAKEGTVMRGLQEYWNSYRYKSEWADKLKEIEGELQGQLAQLSTLMINIYSRAITHPMPVKQASADASDAAKSSTQDPVPTKPSEAPRPDTDTSSSSYRRPLNPELAPSRGSGGSPQGDLSNKVTTDDPAPATQASAPAPAAAESRGRSRVERPDAPIRPLLVATDTIHIKPLSSPLPTTGLLPTQDAVDELHGQPTAADTNADTAADTGGLLPTQDKPSEPHPQHLAESAAVTDSEDAEETLFDAARNGNIQAVTRALRHASPKSRDARGMTALHYAAERDRLAVALLLLDRGADVNAPTSVRGLTPLHLASRSASPEMVEALLERGAGTDVVKVAASDGRTALHFAAGAATDGDADRRDVLRVLRDWGADPGVRDGRGHTARDLAQRRDHWDAASTLRRAEKRWEEEHHQNWFQRHGLAK